MAASTGASGAVETGNAEAESRLLAAAQSGDRAALSALLLPHEQGLFRLCLGIFSGNRADAEDAVQETFLRALRALTTRNGFRGQASVGTYLYRIAVNVCLQKRRGAAPTSVETPLTEPVSPAPGPERIALARDALRRALALLPPRHRALLLLREQEGHSVAEIARILEWSEKKVQNELYKARRALSAGFEETEQ